MKVDYTLLTKTIDALIDGETDPIAKMATIACEVHHSDDRFDWTGFYRVVAPELLKIGPYQGGHGCLVIPFSKGVCGAAAERTVCSWSMMSMPFLGILPVHRPPYQKSFCPCGMAQEM